MSELLRDIGRLVERVGAPAYFVGGCVRDLLRGEPLKDIDIAVAADPHTAGRALVKAFGGHVFWLRQEDEVARVVLPQHDRLQIDLVVLHGRLEEDLRARDLTINAMAVRAQDGLAPGVEILDPTGGRADLESGIVRFVSPGSPVSDPLRVMRALRFKWKLGFALAPGTEVRLRECVPLLECVSTERIRDELFQILALPTAAAALAEVLRLRTAPWLTGSERLGAAAPEELEAAASRVGSLQKLLSHPDLPAELHELLQTEPTPPRRRREVLLWAAALGSLSDSGEKPSNHRSLRAAHPASRSGSASPAARQSPPLDGPEGPTQPTQNASAPPANHLAAAEIAAAARYLALSSDECRLITKAVASAAAAREILERWPVRGRERFHLFRRAAPAGPEAVLFSATEWTEPYRELMAEALRRLLHPEPPLITGEEVMDLTGLKPGPEIGRLLLAVEEERADGNLSTPEQATEWLQQHAPTG